MLSPADSGKFLREIAPNFEAGQIFNTAVEVGIFTKLIEPRSAKALAEELGTDPTLTARILDVLVSREVLAKKEELYTTAPMLAPFLFEGKQTSSLNQDLSRELQESQEKEGKFIGNDNCPEKENYGKDEKKRSFLPFSHFTEGAGLTEKPDLIESP